MSNSLKQFYLQQMGIQQWTLRTKAPIRADLNILAPQIRQHLPFVVIECEIFDAQTKWLAGLEGSLLKQMLNSIGLTITNAVIGFGDASSIEQSLTHYAEKFKPSVIIVFNHSKGYINKAKLSIDGVHLIECLHPSVLMIDPKQKKLAYSILINAQKLILSHGR